MQCVKALDWLEQVFGQPVFEIVENSVAKLRPAWAGHMPKFRIVWRSLFVVLTALLAILIPFFQALMGLVGACYIEPLRHTRIHD